MSPPFQHSAPDCIAALVLRNAGRQEEPQFLRLHADGAVLKEVSDYRDAAKERHLVILGGLRIDHHTAQHDRLAVLREHLIVDGLSRQSGLAQNGRDTAINLCVLDVDDHKDGAVSGNLRRDLQHQNRRDVLR
jgi:hypothetical protein